MGEDGEEEGEIDTCLDCDKMREAIAIAGVRNATMAAPLLPPARILRVLMTVLPLIVIPEPT